MAPAVKEIEPPDPGEVRLFGVRTVVAHADGIARTAQQSAKRPRGRGVVAIAHERPLIPGGPAGCARRGRRG